MTFLTDIEKDLDKLDEGFLRLGSNLKDTTKGFDNLYRGLRAAQGSDKAFDSIFKSVSKLVGEEEGIGKLNKQLSNFAQNSTRAQRAVVGFGAASAGIIGLSLAFADLGFKANEAIKIINSARTSYLQFAGVAKTLDFSSAITGSDELARNFEILDATSNKFFDTAKQGFNVVFNNSQYQSWASDAVSAYAQVEQAAYRLATITVSGNQRSIEILDQVVSATRQLQRETNFTADSVSTLNNLYQIASAGFTDQSSQLAVGAAAGNLSQAGFGDQQASTDALVKTLRALGDSYEDADTRATQIFETTKIGITTVNELSSEIGPLASLAKNLGIEFSEITAALAQLTTQGLSTSEASTALSRFLEEIATNGPQAQEALAGFVDEAGRTVQLGAGALADKGIAGILSQLESATNGQLPAIQRIFSSVESQRAASLLIGSGVGTLQTNTSRIENASPTGLNEEAQNRTKTLAGAFEQAKNESAASIEDLGNAISQNVLSRLEDTNTVLGKLTTGSAEFTGKFAAGLDALKDKTLAVGGFITTTFTTIAGIVIFEKLFSLLPKAIAGINSIFKRFTAGKGETESFWQFLLRRAQETFQKVAQAAGVAAQRLATAFKNAIREIIIDINRIPKEINQISGQIKPQRQLAAAKSPTISNIPSSIKSSAIDVTAIELLPDSTVRKTATNAAKVSQSTSTIGKAFNGLKGIAGGAFGFIGSVIGSTLSTLGLFSAAGIAAYGAFQILSGAANRVASIFNTQANPAIKTLTDSLDELKGNSDITDFVDSLRKGNDLVASTSFANEFQSQLREVKGLWNVITFQVSSYNQFVDRANKAQNLLKQSIQESVSAANNNDFTGRTAESETARDRLSKGLTLSADNVSALEEENNQARAEVAKQIEIQEQKIADAKKRGGINSEEVVRGLENELDLLQYNAEQYDKLFEKRLAAAKAASALNELSKFNVDVPLNVQLSEQSERQVQAEIGQLASSVAEVFNSQSIDPEAYNRLLPELQSAVGAINVQIKADPTAALESLEQIKNVPNFETLLFSDINLRNTFNEAFSAATDAALESAEQVQEIYGTAFNAIKELAPNNAELVTIGNEQNLSGIENQIAIINKELNSGTISYSRQLELLGKIENLEASRIALDVENQIVKELGAQKEALSISEAILASEQAKVNLFSQESQYATGTVASAQARLSAAQQELAVRKQQLETTNREQEIQKEQAVKGLESRLSRQIDTTVEADVTIENTEVGQQQELFQQETSNISKIYDLQTSEIERTYTRQIELIEQTYQLEQQAIANEQQTKLDELNSRGELDAGQQQSVIDALRGLTGNNALDQRFDESKQAVNEFLGVNSNKEREALFNNPEELKKILFDDSGQVRNQLGLENLVAATKNSPAFTSRDFQLNNTPGIRAAQDSISQFQDLFTELDSIASERTAVEETISQANTNNEQNRTAQQEAAERSRERRQQALEEKAAEATRTQKALESAKQDLEVTKAVNEAKVALQLFSNVAAVAKAQLELEFASREALIAQNEQLAESFRSLANNSIFSNSSIGASLNAQAESLAQPVERVTLNIEKAIAQVDSELSLLQGAVADARTALETAKARGASPEQVNALQSSLSSSEEQLAAREGSRDTDIAFLLIKGSLEKTNAVINQSKAVVEAELKAREQLIQQNASLGDAFSTLASTAGSLFSNSAFGNALSRLANDISNPVAQAQATGQRDLAESELRVSALETLFNEASVALEEGIAKGLSDEAIGKLADNRTQAADNLAQGRNQLGAEQQLIQQRTAVNVLNAELTTFASEMQEVTATLTQHADILKETIELEQQKNKATKENNDSIGNLEGSLVKFFGDNPATRALGQRIEFNKLEDERKFQQSEAVSNAKGQIIDLTLQEAQLALEQEAFDNQLTQTDLLAGILKGITGDIEGAKETLDSNESSIEKLDETREQNKALTDQRRGLVQDQIKQIATDLPNQLLNIDRNITAQQLDLLGSEFLNPDLINQTLGRTTSLLNQSERRDINVGSLNDPSFQNDLQDLRTVVNDVVSDTNDLRNNTRPTSNNQSSINAPITINLTVSSEGSTDTGDLSNDIRSQVNNAVTQGFNELSRTVLNSTQ